MGDGGFFRGTSSEQDARFSDKMKKLIRNSKFPKNFFKKVNLKKVQLSVFRPWITRRITELLGVEDDIVIEFALSILDQEKNSPIFMQELWDLLLDAQENPTGIPTKFIEEKKEELRRKKIEEEKIRKRLERERLQESAAREEARLIRQKEREKNPDSSAAALAPPRESTKRSTDRRSPSPYNRSDRHLNSHRSRSRERSSRREYRDSSDRGRDSYRSENRRRNNHTRRSEADDREEHSLRSGRDREKDYNSNRGGNSHDREHKYQSSKKIAVSSNLDDPSLIYDDIQDSPLDYDRPSKRHHK